MNKNKWKSNKGLKIVLAILSILMAGAVGFSGAAVILIEGMGGYAYSKEECLKIHYDKSSYIYSVMAMGNRESEEMREELDKTNFRYGIIKDDVQGAEGLADLNAIKKISDKASYEYCNFETMPDLEAIEREEFSVQEFEVGEGTYYSWDCSVFGYANVYEADYAESYAEDEASYILTEEVPIIGYYYNVPEGIFYYETWDEYYRVDGVKLYVGDSDMKMEFKYDSGQGAYYNVNREQCVVKDYYLTFNAFDGYAGNSWETWNTITLDDVELNHTDIRFIMDENTESGYLQGKPIADRFYSYSDSSEVLQVRLESAQEEPVEEKAREKERYIVISQVRDPLVKTDLHWGYLQGDLFEQAVFVTDLVYTWRYPAIIVLVASAILWIASTVLLLIAAGHRGYYETAEGAGEDEDTERFWVDAVRPGLWQKIFLDVESCLLAAFGCVIAVLMVEMTYSGMSPWNMVVIVTGFGFLYLICLIWLTDFVIRVKLGKWWRSMFIYKCCAWILRKITGFLKRGGIFFRENLTLLWKAILILGGISFLEGFGILVTAYAPEAELSIWFLYRAATLVLILFGIVQANKLKEGAKKLADGDLQEKIDTQKMFWEFKKHGETLNSIGDGMSLAVEKRMQSEHFRTELITNVSHDIKTPLTSIINYVDLLQKEDISNEKAKEYLEVLSRQSARLKKLTEDLIEASKASTGSMSVQMEKLELGVFLTQIVGEFEERLQAAGLHVVMRKPETEILVDADGRHLWRVVENLVQNICKYAQPQTRVYIDLDEKEKEAVISFKNISRYELNISGEELMERFVRGDASRHTEGSGLGLSIAGSLMELMRGKLEIVVDGDLFKVVLHFPKR